METMWMTSDGEEPRYKDVTRTMVEEAVHNHQDELEGMSYGDIASTIISLLDPDNLSHELLSESIMYGLALDHNHNPQITPISEAVELIWSYCEAITCDGDDECSVFCFQKDSE